MYLNNVGGESYAYALSAAVRTDNSRCRDIVKQLVDSSLVCIELCAQRKKMVLSEKGRSFLEGYARHMHELDRISPVKNLFGEASFFVKS